MNPNYNRFATGDKLQLRIQQSSGPLAAMALNNSALGVLPSSYLVQNFELLEKSDGKNNFQTEDGAVDITSITWITNICGRKAPVNVTVGHRDICSTL